MVVSLGFGFESSDRIEKGFNFMKALHNHDIAIA